MKWVREFDPAAVLYAWQGGQEGGEEERAVHDGEDAGRDWRSGLLQDTALESDTQIEAWAGGVRLYMT